MNKDKVGDITFYEENYESNFADFNGETSTFTVKGNMKVFHLS